MLVPEEIEVFASTDVGRKRKHNEDNFLIDNELRLFIVADGMGGHAAGEVASAMAVQCIRDSIAANAKKLADRAKRAAASGVTIKSILSLLEAAVQRASARIHEEARKDRKKRGMGTTVSLILFLGSHGFVAHVGDSRIYLMRNKTVHQVTEDHTIANELMKLGMVTPEQLAQVPRKNAITRAVGVYEHVEVDTMTLEVLPNDRFLLASDGLTGYLDDAGVRLAELLQEQDGQACVQAMIDYANARGGKDNVTAMLIKLGGDAG
ncbi:MAG TPA: Stp1/IreP family PP2C-type Ser/Thr phosphatase, partial [Sorangium sp.]|nr:Stp1/IreP family PP2C-type Ser/Thr phosphatase [Sorangium sp.]